MPTILVIGTITIFSVSFENVSEATVRTKHVNIVVNNYNYASYYIWFLMLNLAYATNYLQLLMVPSKHSFGV